MGNRDIWDKVSKPPREALKTIRGGRLAGMTDINPQWRFQVMTEVFGACGTGWSYEIDKLWTEPGPEGAVMAFALVKLHVGAGIIPGIGGSAMIAKESGGLRANDEAYKMAVTDALSVAMKALGVGAEIYLGRWDGTKYTEAPTTTIAPNSGAGDGLNAKQKQVIADTAILIKDKISEGKEHDAYGLAVTMEEVEDKLYLWSLLDSKERAVIKRMQAAEQKRTDATNALATMENDIP